MNNITTNNTYNTTHIINNINLYNLLPECNYEIKLINTDTNVYKVLEVNYANFHFEDVLYFYPLLSVLENLRPLIYNILHRIHDQHVYKLKTTLTITYYAEVNTVELVDTKYERKILLPVCKQLINVMINIDKTRIYVLNTLNSLSTNI